MQAAHETLFREWLALSLEEKTSDLTDYLNSLDDPARQVVGHWKKSGVYRTYIPAAASPAETKLFLTELEPLLDLMA